MRTGGMSVIALFVMRLGKGGGLRLLNGNGRVRWAGVCVCVVCLCVWCVCVCGVCVCVCGVCDMCVVCVCLCGVVCACVCVCGFVCVLVCVSVYLCVWGVWCGVCVCVSGEGGAEVPSVSSSKSFK